MKIRLFLWSSLIFCLMGCRGHDPAGDIFLDWESDRLKRILIPRQLLNDIPDDELKNNVEIKLKKPGAPPVLGEFVIVGKIVAFEPAIPFTPGLQYELFIKKKKYSEIDIPLTSALFIPEVLGIYPARDTLPENLLKVYIQFSQPMQEGKSAEHIVLVKEKDTLKHVFLDLNQELWNQDRTILTVWFDPGRIKRDLVPNQTMGPPLLAHTSYELIIKSGWRDENGVEMVKSFQKNFVTGLRDSISPDPAKWSMSRPKAGTQDTLKIRLHESLDYMLLYDAMYIVDKNGKKIRGLITVAPGETTWSFYPYDNWQRGIYSLSIEARLEDLAGNNLNRLFDTDLMKPQKKNQLEIYTRSFEVR